MVRFLERINRFVVWLLSVVNALAVIGIPLALGLTTGVIAGRGMPRVGPHLTVSYGEFSMAGLAFGFAAGAVAGALIAVAACGVVAVLIDIRNALARD